MNPKNLANENTPENRRKEKREFAVAIGKHLRKIREARNISQEQLSVKAGYYHTYVNKIEQGKYSPSMHTIWRLSHTLGLSLDDFFSEF